MEEKRQYKLRKRAETLEATRLKIVEAAVELHQEIGPRATTISAIAKRAGVQRLTVYRHFPDETAVFQACTAKWLQEHPLPEPAIWSQLNEPQERVKAALDSFYKYYGETCDMWQAASRDENDVPALKAPMEAVRQYLDGISEDLVKAFTRKPLPEQLMRTTIRHAVSFATWQSLQDLGLDETAKLKLVLCWIKSLNTGNTSQTVAISPDRR